MRVVYLGRMLAVIGAMLIPLVGLGQQSKVVEQYVTMALQADPTLKSSALQVQKARALVKEAKSLYYPKVDILATYTIADGGRTIDLPIGDLLNPAYATLNQLTQSDRFPQLENVSEQLNPHNFYDAKARISAPLLNTDIYYNEDIQTSLAEAEQERFRIAQRNLVHEVKIAYYRWLQASEAISIYKQALQLLEEQVRINTSLLRNGAGTRSALLRSENELQRVNTELQIATTQQRIAAAAFNMLLQRPEEEAILPDERLLTPDTIAITGVLTQQQTTLQTEEIRQLQYTSQALDGATKLASSHWIPKVNAFADFGSQAFDFGFSDKTRYYMAGISVEWNIFTAGTNAAKQERAQAEYQAVRAMQSDAERKISLRYYAAMQMLQSSYSTYKAASLQTSSAQILYNDMQLLYKNGKALYIELLDSYTTLISSQLRQSIAAADILMKLADVERASAEYKL
jgi:outer membrane protein TolC